MKLPPKIIDSSYSKNEIVLSFADAIKLIEYLRDKNILVLGWEGWILHMNGSLGHSISYQGTVDLSNLSPSAALSLVEDTITESNETWCSNPEIENAELLYCITLSD